MKRLVLVLAVAACGAPIDMMDGGVAGGSAAGGRTTGGGSTAGGTASAGGTTAGGSASAGGTTAGGSATAGGTTAGGSATGGGTTAGGTATAGGSTAGGTTAGGSATAGGTTAGGSATAGGSTAGGSAGTRDAGLAVDVFWGNQVTGSELHIFESGQYATRERTCCPPLYREDGGVLTQPQTTALLADIELARMGPFAIEVHDGGLGDTSGDAFAYTAAGQSVLIRRTVLLQQAESNSSSAASRVRTLINSLIAVPID